MAITVNSQDKQHAFPKDHLRLLVNLSMFTDTAALGQSPRNGEFGQGDHQLHPSEGPYCLKEATTHMVEVGRPTFELPHSILRRNSSQCSTDLGTMHKRRVHFQDPEVTVHEFYSPSRKPFVCLLSYSVLLLLALAVLLFMYQRTGRLGLDWALSWRFPRNFF